MEVIADDILIYGAGDTYEEAVRRQHDAAFLKLLERARAHNLKLNRRKLKFKLSSVTYMGHIINDQGLCADPDKVKAVVEMARPEDVQAVQRFIGMINYLSKFLDKLSEVCEPLRRLCDKDPPFDWLHDAAFEKIKKAIAEAPVLRFYDVTKPITVESLWVWVQFSLKTASRSATPVELCPRLSRITTSWRRSASLSVSPWRNLTTMFLGST